MTLDQVCQEAHALTPEAAQMSSRMLHLAAPMAAAWQAEIEHSLAGAAQGSLPLCPRQSADVLHAALHPESRAGWLIGNSDFQNAHRCVVHARLAAERWNSLAMLLLDDQAGNSRH